MKKKLTTCGNTWQLYINKELLQLLGINDKEHTVSIKIQNNTLIVQKITLEKSKNKDNNCIIKKLTKRNSGFGLNFTKLILELLNINPEEDFLNLEIDTNKLIINKVK